MNHIIGHHAYFGYVFAVKYIFVFYGKLVSFPVCHGQLLR